jgi:Monooxygenase af470-like
MVIPKRMMARMQEPFCVFLIGMRINCAWKFPKWLPVFFAMSRMLAELRRQPDLGFKGGHIWFGRTILLLQYWQSFEALTRYARQPELAHWPAWGWFRKNVGNSGDVGIWHETYVISEGRYENIYHNMPPFGLGNAGRLLEITGQHESAAQRIHSNSGSVTTENQ